MGILKILIYSAVLTFPLGVLIRINVFKSAYVYPLDIVLFLIFIYQLIFNFNLKKISGLPIFKPLYIFIFYSFIALVLNLRYLNSESFLVSFLYIVRFVLYTNMIFVFYRLEKDFAKKYLNILSYGGFATVVFGLFQYIFYPDLRKLYYLGWDEHLYRIFSSFLDPNFAGPVFVFELILLLGLMLSNNSKKKIYYIAAIICTFIAIFFTYSRSTLVMFVFSLISFILLIGRKKLIFLVFLVFAFGIIMLPKDIKSEGTVLLRTASILSREYSYKNALMIFKDSPFFGIGFNAYRYAQRRYNLSDPRNWETTHPGAGVSNSLLFVLVTTGVIGFMLYLNFLFCIIKNVIKIRNKNSSIYIYASVFSSIIGILFHSLFENSLFYPFIMFWLFSLVGSYLEYCRK